MNFSLRDYQHRDIGNLRERFRKGDRAVLYQLSTGGGKTVVASFVIDGATKRNLNVWFLVHRQELVRQSIRTLNEIGIPHGVIATGFTPDPLANVQIAMVQTLARRLGKYRAPDLIIQDECHHLRAKTFSSIIDYYPKAKILGLSATPCRLDGMGLGLHCGGHFNSMVSSIPLSELINEGYLCRPRIFAPPVGADLGGLHKRYGEFVQSEVTAAMDKPVITGCAVDHYRKICHKAPAIIFCASVTHAENTAAQFGNEGYQASSIDGSMHDNDRKGRIAALGAGRLDMLTSVDLVSEGFDLPMMVTAIMLRPSASLSMILQQIGRVLRPVYAPGFDLKTREGRLAAIAASTKPWAYIIDHVGNIERHGLQGLGLPEFDPEWSLDGEVKKKKSASASGPGFKQCNMCFSVHTPAPRCPACGHVYEVNARELEQVDGHLREIDPATLERLQKIETDRERWSRVREEQACKTYEDFAALAKKRGYSQSWAGIRWGQKKKRAAATLPGI